MGDRLLQKDGRQVGKPAQLEMFLEQGLSFFVGVLIASSMLKNFNRLATLFKRATILCEELAMANAKAPRGGILISRRVGS